MHMMVMEHLQQINHINTGSAIYIAPGQGFFVASDDVSGDSVTFTKTMQTTSTSDDFISGDIWKIILLKLSLNYTTEIMK